MYHSTGVLLTETARTLARIYSSIPGEKRERFWIGFKTNSKKLGRYLGPKAKRIFNHLLDTGEQRLIEEGDQLIKNGLHHARCTVEQKYFV